MPRQSVQELKTDLEAILREVRDIDLRAEKRRVSSHEVALPEAAFLEAALLQYREACVGLAQALGRSIGNKMKSADTCDSDLIKNELHEAGIELAASESAMGDLGDGSITQRWDRVRAATERWWSALHASMNHRSTCPACPASR